MNVRNARWYKKWWGILVISIISIFLSSLFLFGIYIITLANNIKQSAANSEGRIADAATLKKIEGTRANYFFGAENPRLIIVEFGDYACPYCQKSFPNIREIGLKYQDKVKIIYRDYPVLADYSINLALAARCAGEQGLFWNMHDKLFLNQGISTTEEISTLAEQIGVNKSRFAACFDSQKYYANIAQDISDASALGITGTPTWFVGGQKLEGDIPRDLFFFIIDGLLAEL